MKKALQDDTDRPAPGYLYQAIGLVALLGFALSLAVHIAALLGIDASKKVPFVWVLHIGIFVVFGPFIFLSRKVIKRNPSAADLRELFPAWVVALATAIFAYAIINFLVFMLATHGASPSIRDSKFVLQNHGRLIRELTPGEYTSLRANELRGVSGHWLLFYFIASAYFLFRRKSSSANLEAAIKDP
jgi:hypothetical protein